MSSSGRETLSDVCECWEAFPNVQQWSGDLPDVREWWEAFPNVQQWSGDPSRCPGVVRTPSRMSENG